MLAPYAVHPEASRGRRYPATSHPYRDDFQRDRDRVIHSRAFRRLEDKTQVFTRRYSDHFRNRLTHTIEVAQTSRTIAAALDLNVDLAECLALVHDVGHPPFGHAGEKALDACMREHGEGYDHNLHALRIVEYFEQRYAEFRGLNLTFEVREGIIKHSRDYDAASHPQLQEYLLNLRPPLEAQLIDLTDEIAYNTADLDDGLEAEVLNLDHLREHLGVFSRLYEQAAAAHPQAASQLLFNEAVRKLYDILASDLIEHTRQQIRISGIATLDDVRKAPTRIAGFSSEVDGMRAEVKAYLTEHLYNSPALNADKAESVRVLRDLFALWMEEPEKLPFSYQSRLAESPRHRVVCDYIAGMTDSYVLEQHRVLCGGSALLEEV